MQLFPIPTHEPNTHLPLSYTIVAIELTTIHNIFIRALNSIYLQAPHIPHSEYSDFTTYSLAICRCFVAHDTPGKSTLFTELARKSGERQFVSGHKEFDKPLRIRGNWLESCNSGKNNFSPVMCCNFMDDFLPGLHAFCYHT